MQSKNRYQGVDDYALSCVRYHARQLSQHPSFTPDDFEDIEQDLVLYFLTEAPKFNPEKSSWKLHISMIIKKRAIWLRLQAETQKRGGRQRPLSAHGPVYADDELLEQLDIVVSADGLWGDAFFRWSQLNAEIRTDIQKVISQLPPHLQQVCEWLKEQNPSEIARDTGIPRTTINSAIGNIRKKLREAGLENYFTNVSSDLEAPAKPNGERQKTKETIDG